MKKWIFIVIGILVVGFAGYYFYASKSNNNRQVQAQPEQLQSQKREIRGESERYWNGSAVTSRGY